MDENVNKTDEVVIDPEMDPEGSDQQHDEKKFTQEDVDEIVKKRLQRERKKLADEMNSQLNEQASSHEAELVERETAVACKEFLIENHYPMELLEILGAADVSEFQKKVNQLDSLLKPHGSFPGYNAEPIMLNGMRDDIQKAFSPNVRHKPKDWY